MRYWDWLYCEADASALSLSSFLLRSVATWWWLLLLLWPIWFVLNASTNLKIWYIVLLLSTLSKVVSYALQSTAISNIYLGTTMAGLFWILPKSKVSLQKSLEQPITTTLGPPLCSVPFVPQAKFNGPKQCQCANPGLIRCQLRPRFGLAFLDCH